MARGFLRSLAERLAYPFVRLAERVGTATRDLGNILSRAGTSIEASAIRRIEDAEAEAAARSRDVLGVGETELPDPVGIPEALTKMRREYAWTVKTEYINMIGQRLVQHLTISNDALMTEQQVLQEAADLLDSEEYAVRRGNIISMEVVRVVKAGQLGKL